MIANNRRHAKSRAYLRVERWPQIQIGKRQDRNNALLSVSIRVAAASFWPAEPAATASHLFSALLVVLLPQHGVFLLELVFGLIV